MTDKNSNDTTGGSALTVRQFARQWNISERQVWRLIKTGQLKVVRIGRAVRITKKDADTFGENVSRDGSQSDASRHPPIKGS
jgi:excisionase family DNA binding protein